MKINNKILIAIALFISVSFSVNAQLSHTQKGAVDQKAKSILSKAKDKIKSANGISFTSQIIIKDQEKKEKSRQKARVLLSGNKYQILVEKHIFYCDGNTVWHHNKETKEVVINNIEKEEDNILNPTKLFDNYEKNFKAKFIRENEDGTFVIDLTPTKGKEYHKIRLLIDKKNYQLKNMAMYYYDSSQTEYTIEQYRTDVTTSEADFVFNPAENKGIEIIDMR